MKLFLKSDENRVQKLFKIFFITENDDFRRFFLFCRAIPIFTITRMNRSNDETYSGLASPYIAHSRFYFRQKPPETLDSE